MLRRSIARIGAAAPTIKSFPMSLKRGCSTTGVPIDKALRNDVKMLGKNLGEVIKAQSEDVFQAVEKLRKLGREVSSMVV